MAGTTELYDWLNGRGGVTIHTNNSPSNVEFSIDHTQTARSLFMGEAMKYQIWLKPVSGVNSGTKRYYASDTKPA